MNRVRLFATVLTILTIAAMLLSNATWTTLIGGDCCPLLSNCSTGAGPHVMSTGGDYPQVARATCDATPGCIAFGQMKSFVTIFHFTSRAACEASEIGYGYSCGAAPATVSSYASTLAPAHAKLPWTCETTTATVLTRAAS